MLVFVTGIDSKFSLTKEMVSLVPLKDTRKDHYLFEAVETIMNTFSLNLSTYKV